MLLVIPMAARDSSGSRARSLACGYARAFLGRSKAVHISASEIAVSRDRRSSEIAGAFVGVFPPRSRRFGGVSRRNFPSALESCLFL